MTGSIMFGVPSSRCAVLLLREASFCHIMRVIPSTRSQRAPCLHASKFWLSTEWLKMDMHRTFNVRWRFRSPRKTTGMPKYAGTICHRFHRCLQSYRDRHFVFSLCLLRPPLCWRNVLAVCISIFTSPALVDSSLSGGVVVEKDCYAKASSLLLTTVLEE